MFAFAHGIKYLYNRYASRSAWFAIPMAVAMGMPGMASAADLFKHRTSASPPVTTSQEAPPQINKCGEGPFGALADIFNGGKCGVTPSAPPVVIRTCDENSADYDRHRHSCGSPHQPPVVTPPVVTPPVVTPPCPPKKPPHHHKTPPKPPAPPAKNCDPDKNHDKNHDKNNKHQDHDKNHDKDNKHQDHDNKHDMSKNQNHMTPHSPNPSANKGDVGHPAQASPKGDMSHPASSPNPGSMGNPKGVTGTVGGTQGNPGHMGPGNNSTGNHASPGNGHRAELVRPNWNVAFNGSATAVDYSLT